MEPWKEVTIRENGVSTGRQCSSSIQRLFLINTPTGMMLTITTIADNHPSVLKNMGHLILDQSCLFIPAWGDRVDHFVGTEQHLWP